MKRFLLSVLAIVGIASAVWAAEVNDLSTTDADNTNSSYGFPEGMAPSSVNDNARAFQGMIARWYRDTAGSQLVSGGVTGAITLEPNRTISTLTDGMLFGFEMGTGITGSTTLNVDSTGDKTLKKRHDQDLATGDLEAGQKVAVVYDGTNDTFQIVSPLAVGGGIENVVEDTTPQLGGDLDLNGNAIDFPTTANLSDFLDEDDMVSDSVTAGATQQSIKAYIDTNAGDDITRGTEQATTSGTSVTIASGLSSGIDRITVMFDQISTDGTADLLIQLGDSGGIETSGYVSWTTATGASTFVRDGSTSGFVLTADDAGTNISGSMILSRMSGNKWVAQYSYAHDSSSTDRAGTGGGVKTLSGELTQLLLTTTASDTFDNGNVNILYE